jgi:4-hydroxy-tetrahydrodipicolinate synthase
MYQHFKAIADAVDLPIIIYNIPGRVVVDMSIDTMARLAKLPNIVGVKDSTNDVSRVTRTRLAIGERFCQLSGEDANISGFLMQGGHGCISVTANVAPALCARLHDAWAARDLDTVATVRDRLAPLHDAMFCETNPSPVKYAASLIGKMAADVRLPMVEIAEPSRQRVQTAMRSAGLIN